MSINEYQTIVLNGKKYNLVPVDEKLTYTTKELSDKTGFSKETIYRAKKITVHPTHRKWRLPLIRLPHQTAMRSPSTTPMIP